MAEFIIFQAAVDNDNEYVFSEDEFIHDKNEVSLDSFIDNLTLDGNPLDYYGFTNVTRAISCAEEDPFSESDVEKILDNNVEARNYWVNSEDETSKEGGVSADTTKNLKKFIYNFDNVSENDNPRPS